MNNQQKIRAGFPATRDLFVREGLSPKGVVGGRELNRVRLNAKGRVERLHATKGWRVL